MQVNTFDKVVSDLIWANQPIFFPQLKYFIKIALFNFNFFNSKSNWLCLTEFLFLFTLLSSSFLEKEAKKLTVNRSRYWQLGFELFYNNIHYQQKHYLCIIARFTTIFLSNCEKDCFYRTPNIITSACTFFRCVIEYLMNKLEKVLLISSTWTITRRKSWSLISQITI